MTKLRRASGAAMHGKTLLILATIQSMGTPATMTTLSRVVNYLPFLIMGILNSSYEHNVVFRRSR
jgi:hypothetical protein